MCLLVATPTSSTVPGQTGRVSAAQAAAGPPLHSHRELLYIVPDRYLMAAALVKSAVSAPQLAVCFTNLTQEKHSHCCFH